MFQSIRIKCISALFIYILFQKGQLSFILRIYYKIQLFYSEFIYGDLKFFKHIL